MIKVECKSCGAKLKASEKFAGRKAKCPKCGEMISAPVKKQDNKPATEKQKEFAESLGIEFPPDVDKKTISTLIDEKLEIRDKKKFQRMIDLGNKESEAYQELHELVRKEVEEFERPIAKATPDEMLEELDSRGIGAILISFDLDDIDDLIEGNGGNGGNATASSGDSIEKEEMITIIKNIGLQFVKNYADEMSNSLDRLNEIADRISDSD